MVLLNFGSGSVLEMPDSQPTSGLLETLDYPPARWDNTRIAKRTTMRDLFAHEESTT
jgi:hypothetical protein